MSPKTPPGQTRGQIYRFVRERLIEGRPPTIRDVQRAFGFRAVQTARAHLEALVTEGKLTKRSGVARGYGLPGSAGKRAPLLQVPLIGRVQAGALTTAIEEPDGYLAVEERGDGGDLFALTVRGESMTGAGILPGDMVIVRRQADADNGDIVVALVDDEATVKRLKKVRGKVGLYPENPAFEPIFPAPDDLVLLGKVVELRRMLG